MFDNMFDNAQKTIVYHSSGATAFDSPLAAVAEIYSVDVHALANAVTGLVLAQSASDGTPLDQITAVRHHLAEASALLAELDDSAIRYPASIWLPNARAIVRRADGAVTALSQKIKGGDA